MLNYGALHGRYRNSVLQEAVDEYVTTLARPLFNMDWRGGFFFLAVPPYHTKTTHSRPNLFGHPDDMEGIHL